MPEHGLAGIPEVVQARVTQVETLGENVCGRAHQVPEVDPTMSSVDLVERCPRPRHGHGCRPDHGGQPSPVGHVGAYRDQRTGLGALDERNDAGVRDARLGLQAHA